MEPTKTPSNTTAGSRPVASNDVDLVDDAKGLAGKVADQARDLVGGQMSQQQERSAGQLGKVAEALRETNLADTVAGPYAEKAAAMLDRLSSSVRDATLADTVRAGENFARREPLLFLGGAFAIGLLAARFLKSSAQASRSDDQLMLPPGKGDGQMYAADRSYGAGSMRTGSSGGAGSSRGMGSTGGPVAGGSTGGATRNRPARGTGPQGNRGPDGSD